MYDVLHDSEYRKNWDPNMLESVDIARISDNADVGYYSCEYSVELKLKSLALQILAF